MRTEEMPRKRSRAKTGEIDDVVVFPVSVFTDQDDAEVAVRELFTRVGNIADERRMQLPACARLIDSNGLCFRELSLTGDADTAQRHATASKLLHEDKLTGNPLPWFLVLEDAQGQCVKVRLELGSQPFE